MGKGNPNRTHRDPSSKPDDIGSYYLTDSLARDLAKLDTTQEDTAAFAEETRSRLHAVPDLKVEHETMTLEDALATIATFETGDTEKLQALEKEYEKLFTGDDLKKLQKTIGKKYEEIKIRDIEGNKQPEDEIKANSNKRPEPVKSKPVKAERKQESKQSQTELLAQLIGIVEGVDDMNKLEDFTRDCRQKGLLMWGKSEKGWWVKPLKDSENSKALVDSISKRKNELIDKVRLAGQLRKIEKIDDIEELRRHVRALKHFGYIKIGAKGEPIVDDQVPGSKEIVETMNKQREKILAENKEKASMEALLKKFGKR